MNQTIVPGTFELDNAQKGAIKLSIQLGPRIQELFPLVAEDYRSGKSLADLVKEYHLKDIFAISEKTAQEAIRYALKGYHGEIGLFFEFYRGLLNTEEYGRLAEEHHKECGRRLGKKVGHESGKKTFEEGTGVHGLNHKEKHSAGQKGIIRQGHIPWSDNEIKRLYNLSQNPEYKRKTRINSKKIAEIINQEFHQGKHIRTSKTTTRAFTRYNNRLNELGLI